MRRLVSAFAAVFVLVLVAKGSGALKEVAIASRLGTAPAVDLYILAFTVATWPAAVLMSILTISLTPLLSTTSASSDPNIDNFVSQLLSISVALGIVTGAVFYFFFPMLAYNVYGSNAAATALVKSSMLISMALTASFALPVALCTVLVIGKGRNVGTLLEGAPSLVLFLLLCTPVAAAEALGIGTLLGFVIQLALLLVVQRVTLGRLRFGAPSPNIHWAALKRGASYSAFGYSILAVAPLVEQVLAGALGPGAISSLGYASRVTALATGLVVTAINRVSLPYFSKASAGDRRYGPGAAQITVGFLVVGLVMSLVMAAVAQPLVSLLFQRGHFSAEDTETVAHLLRWNLTQLAPYFVSVVLAANLAARGRFREIFTSCLLGFVVRAICAAAGAQFTGLTGVATAATFGYLAMAAYLSWKTSALRGEPR
jgi:peptidoglycan biosynthesis protein MviN/MurJ (putative lipid II flippase)